MNSLPRTGLLVLLSSFLAVLPLAAADYIDSLKVGSVELKSAGPLAFGPEGILFVGDSMSAAVIALDTGDRAPGSAAKVMDIRGIDEKVAALLGTTPNQIMINDMAVNPISKRTYLSISRGRGPDAMPVILRTDGSGGLEEFSLTQVGSASVNLPNTPDPQVTDRSGTSLRMEAITDLAFVDDRVFVAGLSNEEFASKLRSIPFPFVKADTGTSVEIFHGSHGRFETNAPVRTFVPYEIKGVPHILAAYTCTPLVSIPVSELKPGSKVMGKTIAELGNRNRPLDMIVYAQNGRDFILMNNSSRGVMKIPATALDSYGSITEPTDMAGVPYETVDQMTGIEQLDQLDETSGLVLQRVESGSLDLRKIALP